MQVAQSGLLMVHHKRQMDCSDASPEIARIKLRTAAKDCSERGLCAAAKWYTPDMLGGHLLSLTAECQGR